MDPASAFVVDFEGRVYHAPGIRPYTAPLVLESGTSVRTYTGSVRNIGLKQGNPTGGPAEVSLELHLQIDSSGDINADRARALGALKGGFITLDYRKAP
jgi:hypothetical protein